MNIHEYQTKELLRGYGVPVPDGRVAHNVDNAATVAEELGGDRWVVKAQIMPAAAARAAVSRSLPASTRSSSSRTR